jgi:hypothetical protein
LPLLTEIASQPFMGYESASTPHSMGCGCGAAPSDGDVDDRGLTGEGVEAATWGEREEATARGEREVEAASR